jgi:glutamyl-tRNA reductase
MRLFAVGISHRTAPVELRECVDFARRGVDAALSALAARNVTREAVVLSTCNRAEIYGGAETDEAAESCGRFISEFHGIAWDALAPHVVIYRGPAAADHLFRVAAGLDSLVVGEPQILGQVKDAFATAAGL